MIEVSATYEGELRCVATHGPSSSVLFTDAPTDNHGKGEAFSPTDLVATAFATCVMTVIGIVARREGIELRGMSARVEKHMVVQPTRRIGHMPLHVSIPGKVTPEQRRKLEAAARTCPVHKSLHPDVSAPIEFTYPDA
ncbi:MAG: OsmC family protein [Planctomycetota bacterium]